MGLSPAQKDKCTMRFYLKTEEYWGLFLDFQQKDQTNSVTGVVTEEQDGNRQKKGLKEIQKGQHKTGRVEKAPLLWIFRTAVGFFLTSAHTQTHSDRKQLHARHFVKSLRKQR